MIKPYAGIGSRETPDIVLVQMTKIARYLESKGFTLRSGGAPKADDAFEKGVSNFDQKQIYIPWYNFNGRGKGIIIDSSTTSNYTDIQNIAKHFHPAWFRLTDPAKKLMCRNVPQVLGKRLDPKEYSRFVICWTKDGKASGGTGQAIRIAEHYNIPVYNLFNPDDVKKLGEFLRSL